MRGHQGRLHLLIATLATSVFLGANCTPVLPPPTVAELAGEWRVVVPTHWLERKQRLQIDLRLKSDGTYFESERWGTGLETATGRWSIVRNHTEHEALFTGTKDNGTKVSFPRPLFRRARAWVLGVDGGPDLGHIYFERVSAR